MSEADCDSPAVYKKSCACGEAGTETFESGEALGHDMVTKYDGTHHWTECDRDGCDEATEKVAHSGGTATVNTYTYTVSNNFDAQSDLKNM